MAEKTKIEWTDSTWNPITGCKQVSTGCKFCYAQTLAGTRLKNHPSRKGLTDPGPNGPVWNGTVRFNEDWLMQPIKWKLPRRIFVCAHSDLFYPEVVCTWINKIFAVMSFCPQHQFQVLTKRPEIAVDFLNDPSTYREVALRAGEIGTKGWIPSEIQNLTPFWAIPSWPLRNVWIGTSVENQATAEDRIPHLSHLPDKVIKFLSIEPLLERINLLPSGRSLLRGIDWVIVGGESGKKARPMKADWVREIRDECLRWYVPFFFKQWGEYNEQGERVGKKAAGRMLDGIKWGEMPN